MVGARNAGLFPLIKRLKTPSSNFNIYDYVSFSQSSARFDSNIRLKHIYCKLSTTRHFFFYRIVRLWNYLPSSLISLSQSYSTVEIHLKNHFSNHFHDNFDCANSVPFISSAHAQLVQHLLESFDYIILPTVSHNDCIIFNSNVRTPAAPE